MSSPSQNDAAKPKPTEKQMDLLALIMQNLKAQPDVDVSFPPKYLSH